MKNSAQPGDELRARHLELCSEIIELIQAARNHGLKPGNAWLARSELAKAFGLLTEVDQLLNEIKLSDKQL
jgi:hypothetical protein